MPIKYGPNLCLDTLFIEIWEMRSIIFFSHESGLAITALSIAHGGSDTLPILGATLRDSHLYLHLLEATV